MSDNNMDDLLAQLKTEFEPKPDKKSNQTSANSSTPTPDSATKPSIVEQLEQLSRELESGRGRTESPEPAANSARSKEDVRSAAQARQQLNAAIDRAYQAQERIREEKLAEIKRQEQAKIAEEQRRQEEAIALQKRAELRERKRKEALREKAKQWLKTLNPRSEEGQWFEEFSYSYEDKLQAAVDYLEAMRETGL